MQNAALSWITENTSTGDIKLVSNLLPDRFAAYFKVFFPLAIAKDFPVSEYQYEPDTIENLNKRLEIGKIFFEANNWEQIKLDKLSPISYRALAERYEISYEPTISFRKIMMAIGHRPFHIQRHLTFEVEVIRNLIKIFGKETPTEFHGHTDEVITYQDQRLEQNWFIPNQFSFFDKLFLILNEKNSKPFPVLPHYIFNQQKDWCIAVPKILGADYLIIGADKLTAQKVRSAKNIEVVELNYPDSFIK